MKTLDEVIKAIEVCRDSYVAGKIIKTDALHYLREYRQTRQDLLDGMKRLENKEMMYIKAIADLEDNPPLSFDELKQMEGKPVWIKPDGMKGFWDLIDVCNETEMIGRDVAGYADYFYRCNQGEQWQAYRKERE